MPAAAMARGIYMPYREREGRQREGGHQQGEERGTVRGRRPGACAASSSRIRLTTHLVLGQVGGVLDPCPCPYQSLGPRAVMAEFLFRLASEDPGRTLFARRHQDPSRSQNVRRLKSSGDAGRIWVVTGKPTKEEAGMRPLRQSPQRLEGSAANATPTWGGKWMGT